jgi:hypothetical protein
MSTDSALPDIHWNPSAFKPENLGVFGYLGHEIDEVHLSSVNESGT